MLYNHRNEEEARTFIDNLLAYLQPPADSTMLDLACGAGRHAIYLAEKGYEVTGIDLSEESIARANESAHERLEFFVHDMRHLFRTNYYHYIFNLFTSFGYFEKEQDNINTLKAAHKALKPGGTLVIDFMNAEKVIAGLNPEETVVKDGIPFHITRKVTDGRIVKTIRFEDKREPYYFEERVQALKLEDFKRYFKNTGFNLADTFGNYALEPFDADSSDRLILIAEK